MDLLHIAIVLGFASVAASAAADRFRIVPIPFPRPAIGSPLGAIKRFFARRPSQYRRPGQILLVFHWISFVLVLVLMFFF